MRLSCVLLLFLVSPILAQDVTTGPDKELLYRS